jgi:LysM repeat protein
MRVGTKCAALFCALILAVCCLLSNSAYANVKYNVKPGDTLWGIARTYHTTIQNIQRQNHLTSTTIRVHQPLVIPSKYTRHTPVKHKRQSLKIYHIVRGDTLWDIAVRHRMSVEQLKLINHLHSNTIYPGQKLLVDKSKIPHIVFNPHVKQAIRKGVPLNLIPVYQDAGRRYGIPWTVLAAIHHIETNFSTGYLVSPCGALGPMQFMPSTFRVYGVTAPGRKGRPDINNVYDAIYTAAHMLQENGYNRNPFRALYAYNHSGYYVQCVQSYAQGM